MRRQNTKNKTRASRQASTGSNKQLTILPKPDFNPEWPRKNTLAYHALLLMLQGKKISHPDFDQVTGSWRLAAHILILKKLGWPINDEFIEHSNSVGSKECKISLYFIDKHIAAKVKVRGGAL